MKLFKKIATVLAAAALIVSAAGNAMAYFEQGNLVRVVYDKNLMKEVATDLGSVTDIIAGGAIRSDSFLTGDLAGSSLSDLRVAYFTVKVGVKDLWLSSVNETQNLNGTTGWTANSGGIASVLSRYSALSAGSTSTVTLGMSDANSYWVKMDGTGVKVGNFNTSLTNGVGEISLAALSDPTASVALNLFFWDTPTTASTLAGVSKLTLLAHADGTTTSAVPIPPAFFLMGSGLLGMIGLRRRMA